MKYNGFSVVAACALAAAVGCGGSSSSSSSPAADQTVAISGSAVKGIIKNGVVKIYGVSDGTRRSEALISGRTAVDGSYSLEVTGYEGPVVVEISALTSGEDGYPSLMVCDLPDGCGSVAFGDDYTLQEGFSLDAVIPSVSDGEEVSANVTALTDMAAAYAEVGGISADSANDANAQIANLFSLSGSLLSLEVVDLTDEDAMEAASEKTQRAALLSAALLSAGVEAGGSIEEAIGSISEDFASNGGQLLNSESSESSVVTLLEVMEQAQTILDNEIFDNIDNLGAVTALVDNLVVQVGNAPVGERTSAEAPDEQLGSDVEVAAAFISDLRDVATASAFEDIETGATQFSDNLSVAGDLVNGDVELVLEAMAMAADAIGEAFDEAAENATSHSATNGITVAISGDSYTVDQTVNVTLENGAQGAVDVELSATGTLDFDETDNDQSGTETIDVDMNVVGVASNDALRLNVSSGDVVLSSTSEWADGTNSWSDSEEVSTASFDLDVTLTQLAVDSPASFVGSLEFSITGYSLDEQEQFDGSFSESSSESFNTLSLALNGTFAKGSNSFAATFTLSAKGNGFVATESYSDANGYDESEETAQEFISGSFALGFSATFPGVTDSAQVTLTGNRTALETGTASLELAFNGKTLDADLSLSNGESAELTISNHNDVVLLWEEEDLNDEESSESGTMTVSGRSVATVAEESGIIVIRYLDGTMESL